MAGPKSTTEDVKDMEAITSGLTRTVLGDDAVSTDIAVKASTKVDDMDAIANSLGQTVLEEDDRESLTNLPAAKEKAVGDKDREAELNPAGIAEKQAAEKEEEGIDALGTACGSLSLKLDDEADDQREAQRLRKQIQMAHEDKMRALENAEARRRADEEFDTFTRQFQADIDGAKVKQMKRKARKEKNEEASRQLRLAAKAEAIVLAERRAQQERRMQEEARVAQAQRESDNRARLELSQIYERIFADAAIAQANAEEVQWQRQRHEVELIAQYHAVVARQAQLAELERLHQEELFLRQHQAEQRHALEEQVFEAAEEMDTSPEWNYLEGAEMDTAPEMEASASTEMDWEQVGEKTPLLAEPLLRSPQSMKVPPPSASKPSAAAEELPSSGTLLVVNGLDSQVLKSEAISSRTTEEKPALPEADQMSASSHASTVANTIAAPPSAAGPNTADGDQQPATPAAANAATVIPAATITAPEEAPAPAETVAPAPTIAAPAAPSSVPRLLPRSATPPPPPEPMLAPMPSNPKAIKITFKSAIPNPTLAALRPTITESFPLGRLLSQQKSIPQVALPQVLGKRVRKDWKDGGRDEKKAKLEGEFRFEVGGKRKREVETFPGKKRALFNRQVLVVPYSRLTTSPSIASANLSAPPPTHPPTSAPPNALPASSSPSQPPHPTVKPLPANLHRDLAEAIEFYNDLPTLKAEIAWMRAQRLNTSSKETRGKNTLVDKTSFKRVVKPASYWSRYRQNLPQ